MTEIFYDKDSNRIEDSTKTIRQLDGKRFRIFMDIVLTCFGSCTGCPLSFADRKNTSPEMSAKEVRRYLDFFIPMINQKVKEKGLFTSVVNLGTGDYFAMDQVFLDNLFKEIAEFFSHLDTPRNVMTITTSLFMKPVKMRPKIEAIQKHLRGNQFAIEGVVDPVVLDKHYNSYLENYKAIVKEFPFFDLVVNLSNQLEEKDIHNLMRFFKELNLLSFDIQYALNKTNVARVKADKHKLMSLLQIIENKSEDKERMLGYNLAIPSARHDDNKTIFDHIRGQAKEIMSERYAVKGDGSIYPLAFGYGDILLDEKYDMPRVGHVNDSFFDEEKAVKLIEKFLIDIFKKNKVCHTCEYSAMCYSTGYSFYNKFEENPRKCDNVGWYIFEGLKNNTWLAGVEDTKKN